MKVLCVLNPWAAGGAAMEYWPKVEDMLRHLGVEYDLLSVKEGVPLADQVVVRLTADGVAIYGGVAGIGGDGTHSGIINGLMRFKASHPDQSLPPYTFIPLGTGNDIAKSLGIRTRDEFPARALRRAVSAIVHGADYDLDLGVINDLYFADALTVGLDSRILRERNASKRTMERVPLLRCLVRGRFLYTLSLGRRFLCQERVEADITTDGRLWYKGPMLNLVVNNTRIYAGGFDFSEDAYADDGLLDVVLFTAHSDYLARYLLAMRHNPHRIRQLSDDLHRRSMQVQCRRLSIRLSRPESIQVDGEEWPDRAALDVGVVRHALRIRIPAEPV
jgi:diacylglycerol kinase family enzyme